MISTTTDQAKYLAPSTRMSVPRLMTASCVCCEKETEEPMGAPRLEDTKLCTSPATRGRRARGEISLRSSAGLLAVTMEQAEGWERLGELSRLLRSFRRMYVRREVEEDNPSLLNWRLELVEFLKVKQSTWYA